jgi:NTP-dependent ternary system trypsin peptidase co-occuring protein
MASKPAVVSICVLSFAVGAVATKLSDGRIGIPELVERVRAEMIESERRRTAVGASPLFVAKSVDLEIAFGVKRESEGASKFTLEVIELDAREQVSSETVQKMTLHLDVAQPQDVVIPPSNAGDSLKPARGKLQ